MSKLRERQMEAVRANEERTRAEDAHRAAQQRASDQAVNEKIARAHASGKTKAEQVTSRVWPGGKAPRRGG